MGFVIVVAGMLYLLISLGVVVWAVSYARKNGKSAKRWGWGAALGMYLLVFWDWVPTVVAHKYYCATEAGFWVYKTPEQWKKENLGSEQFLKESLSPTRLGLEKPSAERTWMTQRFYADTLRFSVLLPSLTVEQKVFYDAKTRNLIAKSTNYWKGKSGGVFAMGGSINEFRQALVFDWSNRQCDIEGKSTTDSFNQFVYQFWKSGEGK